MKGKSNKGNGIKIKTVTATDPMKVLGNLKAQTYAKKIDPNLANLSQGDNTPMGQNPA